MSLYHKGLLDDVEQTPEQRAAALRVLTDRGALDIAWMVLGVAE